MNHNSKNKLLTWLVILLLVANAATIALFWVGKKKPDNSLPRSAPKEFLVKELGLDSQQKKQLDLLVSDHRSHAEQLRKELREAKDRMFALIKQPNTTDSLKKNAARVASQVMEELDLITLDHFAKVRAICNLGQQKKFDEIILEVTRMMAQPRTPMRPGGPPPDGPPAPGERPGPPEN